MQEELLTPKEKNQIDFNKKQDFFFLLKFKFYKSKFSNTCMSSQKLPSIFDINTFRLF